MKNLENLQNMAENGDISKKLLSDEDFKSKFKEALKKERGIEVKDEDIPQIIKNFEETLKDKNFSKSEGALGDDELDNISGGMTLEKAERLAWEAEQRKKSDEKKAKWIKGISKVAGSATGIAFGALVGNVALSAGEEWAENHQNKNIRQMGENFKESHGLLVGSLAVGGGLRGYMGGRLVGNLICEHLGLQN